VDWVLVPNAELVHAALSEARGPELFKKWQELLQTAPWSTLGAAYAVAFRRRLGGAVVAHYRTKAASGGFEIVRAS